VLLLWRTVCRFLKKLNIELYGLAIPFLGVYPGGIEGNNAHTETCTQMFIVALFILARRGKQNVIYPLSGILRAVKRNEVLIYATTWLY